MRRETAEQQRARLNREFNANLRTERLQNWYRNIDWRMLARQKKRLYRLADEAKDPHDMNALVGVIEAIEQLFDIKENRP